MKWIHVKWMHAAATLSKIAIFGKIQVNRQTTQTLVLSLEKYRFETRRDNQGSIEYKVVDRMEDEIQREWKGENGKGKMEN